MSKLFKIEMNYAGRWDDAEWTQGDKPLRFKTKAKAQEAINELVEDTKEAVKMGNMEEAANSNEYRIVPV